MSKRAKQKRQSPYRCRWGVNPTGGLHVITSQYARNIQSSPLDADEMLHTKLDGRAGLDSLVSGPAPTEHDWANVSRSVNTALLLAEDGYGVEHQDVFIKAQEGLLRACQRHATTDKWRLDGQAIQDIRDALYLHDQQCELVTNGDYLKALRAVKQRVIDGDGFSITAAA